MKEAKVNCFMLFVGSFFFSFLFLIKPFLFNSGGLFICIPAVLKVVSRIRDIECCYRVETVPVVTTLVRVFGPSSLVFF